VLLLAGAALLRIWYAWPAPGPERLFDERYILRNVRSALVFESWRPQNAFYSGLSWLPLTVVYAVADRVADATGEEAVRPFVDRQPTVGAYRIGRLLGVLYGVLSIWLLVRIGSGLFDVDVGLVAGLILAAAPLHIRVSGIVKPDVLLLVMSLVAVVATMRAAVRPNLRSFTLAGAAVGLAAASKYNGAAAAWPLVALAVLLTLRRRSGRPLLWLGVSGALAILVFLAFDPWVLTDPGLVGHALKVQTAQYRAGAPWPIGEWHGRQVLHLVQTLLGPAGHGPLTGAAALAGVPWLAWRLSRRGTAPRLRKQALIAALFVCGWVANVCAFTPRRVTESWLLILPWSSLSAAVVCVAAWRWVGSHWRGLRRPGVAAIAAAALVVALSLPAVLWTMGAARQVEQRYERKLDAARSDRATERSGPAAAPDLLE